MTDTDYFEKKMPGLGKEFWINAGLFMLCLTLFLMPFPRKLSLYSLGGFLFCGLVIWMLDFRNIIRIWSQKAIILFPLVFYFLIHVAGLFFTEPKWSFIEPKLMFLLIPVFGFPVLTEGLFKKNIHFVLSAFIFGILLIFTYELGRAIWNSCFQTGEKIKSTYDAYSATSYFKSEQLSVFEHPTYRSLKVALALVFLPLLKEKLKIPVGVIILIAALLITYVYLLSSLSGIVITCCLILLWLYKLLKVKRMLYLLFILIPLMMLLTFKISFLNERINNKISDLLIKFNNKELVVKKVDPRLNEWLTTIELIREHPFFGVGLNSRDILANQFNKNGFPYEASIRLNSHNQFLETQLAFGIPGTLILLWMLLTPLIRRNTWNQSLIIPFLIIVCISMLFESILVRQWGIMFFVLFYCILLIPEKPAQVLSDSEAYKTIT